jgi:hypothetical protein
VVYRHVDLLNEAGISASVVHARTGFRCTWFENDTRVLSCREVAIGPQDLVVAGELAARLVVSLPPGYRFAVFNQGPHLTWRVAEELVQHSALSPDLAAMLTVSDHGVRLLRHAFPKTDVRRLHNSINPDVFFHGDAARPRRIAYMPRRGRDEVRQVLGVLHSRGALAGWEVTALEDLNEREVGERLRSSMIFLSFAYQEGFGLPAAEAMASGAYVVGFHGFGGLEFFRPEFSSPVETGDVIAFARTLEQVLERERLAPGWCTSRGSAAASFIKAEYSPARERQDVVDTYASLMRQPRAALRPFSVSAAA